MTAGAESPSESAQNAATARKPRFAIFIATACGLGYIPKAPGTFGALLGAAIYARVAVAFPLAVVPDIGRPTLGMSAGWLALTELPVAIAIAIIGVWASGRTARYHGAKDPQFVVIDEVSGQNLTNLLGLAPANWKYLLLGFILFRLFDIWKPFPVRQAESLPGGWGIMADDWVAAIYAAIGLWIARAAGL